MPNQMYDAPQFVQDVAKACACMTSGLQDAEPEEDDFQMARIMLSLYNYVTAEQDAKERAKKNA